MTIRRQPATGGHRSLCTSVRRHRHPYRSREDEYDTLYGWYRERETELIRALGRLYIVDPDGPYWDGIRNDDGTLQEVWFARRQNFRTPTQPWLAPRGRTMLNPCLTFAR
jgi:hypothetical protein